MIHALGLFLAIVHIETEANTRYCPAGAIGYVRVVKDGYRIANGTGYSDSRTGILTAWFPPKRSSAQVFMTLNLEPVNGRIQLHAEGRGSIRISHGTFCAFPVETPPPIWKEDFPGPPSGATPSAAIRDQASCFKLRYSPPDELINSLQFQRPGDQPRVHGGVVVLWTGMLASVPLTNASLLDSRSRASQSNFGPDDGWKA